ncbi:MAG: formylglycine-generating enzyme family protein [Bacteroidota bacterium]
MATPSAFRQRFFQGLAMLAVGLTASSYDQATVEPDLIEPFDPSTIEFVRIPAGTFRMGDIQGVGFNDERPIREVTIREEFYLGVYEVTQDQWAAVMGADPGRFIDCGRNCPVEGVSWQDIQMFIDSLNTQDPVGNRYRLPTEAEWEYAARAGTETLYGWGNEAPVCQAGASNGANFGDCTDEGTVPVGTYAANAWGLYDMHGNVWEWVQDWYGPYQGEAVTDPEGARSGSFRILRGGAWYNGASGLRSANRLDFGPDKRFDFIGFRLVRMAP